MTRAQFEKSFKEVVECTLSSDDKPALRQAWNDNIDSQVKGGTLPDRARDWSHPRRFYRYGSEEKPAAGQCSLRAQDQRRVPGTRLLHARLGGSNG